MIETTLKKKIINQFSLNFNIIKVYMYNFFYFFKFTKIIFFFFNLNNFEFKLKLILFFKKINSFFYNKNYKNIISTKTVTNNETLVYTKVKSKFKVVKDNQYLLTNKILKTIFLNRRVIKNFFFKKFSRQSKITQFINNISKKNKNLFDVFNTYLLFILVRSHLFFFIEDVKFFLKVGFVKVNGLIQKNKFFELKCNDCIQLVNSNFYYDYFVNINNFFYKKLKKLKYKR